MLDGTGNRRDEGAKGSICLREASVCSAQTRHGTYAVMGGFGRQVELLMHATALGVTGDDGGGKAKGVESNVGALGSISSCWLLLRACSMLDKAEEYSTSGSTTIRVGLGIIK